MRQTDQKKSRQPYENWASGRGNVLSATTYLACSAVTCTSLFSCSVISDSLQPHCLLSWPGKVYLKSAEVNIYYFVCFKRFSAEKNWLMFSLFTSSQIPGKGLAQLLLNLAQLAINSWLFLVYISLFPIVYAIWSSVFNTGNYGSFPVNREIIKSVMLKMGKQGCNVNISPLGDGPSIHSWIYFRRSKKQKKSYKYLLHDTMFFNRSNKQIKLY